MERSSISIDLKSISCKGVKFFNLFQKPSLYAVVSVGSGGDRSDQKHQQKQRTPVDHSGGENPEWDHRMRFEVGGRDRDLLLEFDVMANGILGDKVVGRARIPLTDLDFTGALRHVSYQVRSPEGKPNGVLSFSYNIKNPEAKVFPTDVPAVAADHYPTPPPPSAPPMGYYPPPVSFPAPTPTPVPAPAFPYYSAPDPSLCYQAPGAGYFPRPDMGYGWPAQTTEFGGYYPPPPPPPMQVAYPPQPAPAYCYPAPQGPYGCQPECCDRRIYW